MITWFYLIVFMISLVMTSSFLFRNKNVDTKFIFFSFLVNLNCMGRYIIASSKTIEPALLGNVFLYMGGCYAPALITSVLGKLCNIKKWKVLNFFMWGYSSCIMLFVILIGKNGWYYKTVRLGHDNGYSYLIKEYGPFHVLYPIMMMMYAIIMLSYIIKAIKVRERISLWTVFTASGIGISIIVIYMLERLFGVRISYLSVGYLMGIILLIKHFEHISMYDMSANIVSSIEKMKEYGYVVIDNRKRYINANDYIKEVFPVIRTWKIDKEIPDVGDGIYSEIKGFIENFEEDDTSKKYIRKGERHFQVEIRTLSYGRKKNIGYLLEFIDRTMEKRYYNTIEDYNESLAKEVAEKTEDILRIKDMMVLGMAELLEGRDDNTGGHIKRTSHVVRILVETIQKHHIFLLDRGFCRNIIKAAPMHDLGKIAIDDRILKKPGKLTLEEFEIIKTHSERSAVLVERILKGVEEEEFIKVAVNIARYHHEKWNGSGYPEGLRGTDIPLEARIMAIADVYDALVSKRCYKQAMSFEEAYQVMMKSMGTHFDPALEKAFVLSRKKLETYYEGFGDLEEAV